MLAVEGRVDGVCGGGRPQDSWRWGTPWTRRLWLGTAGRLDLFHQFVQVDREILEGFTEDGTAAVRLIVMCFVPAFGTSIAENLALLLYRRKLSICRGPCLLSGFQESGGVFKKKSCSYVGQKHELSLV